MQNYWQAVYIHTYIYMYMYHIFDLLQETNVPASSGMGLQY